LPEGLSLADCMKGVRSAMLYPLRIPASCMCLGKGSTHFV
jgi:hypothetical protein